MAEATSLGREAGGKRQEMPPPGRTTGSGNVTSQSLIPDFEEVSLDC